MKLKDKIALVTGAGSSLGKTYASALASEGACVVIGDLDGAAARDAASELSATGARALGLEMDVSKDSDVDAAVEATVSAFGGVDILVNNAGLARGRTVLCSELSTQEWSQIFAVNVIGQLACARACRPWMAARGGGIIVNQSSMAAYHNPTSAYAVSKLALSGLTVALASEYSNDNIRVNGIAPGMMTGRLSQEMMDGVVGRQLIHRRGVPEDLIGTLLFLCSDDSQFMTGQTLIVDGGTVRRP